MRENIKMNTQTNFVKINRKSAMLSATISADKWEEKEERSRKKGKIDRRKARDNKRNWEF